MDSSQREVVFRQAELFHLVSQKELLIVTISMKTNTGRNVYGTGFFISSDLILTAAHNLFHKETSDKFTNMKVYYKPFKHSHQLIDIDGWKYNQDYETCKEDLENVYDIALIKTTFPINEKQFFDIEVLCLPCTKAVKQLPLSIFGYPGLISKDPKVQNFKLGLQGVISIHQMGSNFFGNISVAQSDHTIHYEVNTDTGHSGSPIVYKNKVIAIHLGGRSADNYNFGRYFTYETFATLEKWRSQLKGEKFIGKAPSCCEQMAKTGQILSSMHTKLLYSQNLSLKVYQTSQLSHLEVLNIAINNIAYVDLQPMVSLKVIDASANQLTAFDTSFNTNLVQININHNKIKTLSLQKNLSLVKLSAAFNMLEVCNLYNNTLLEKVNLHSNQIVLLDFTKNAKIRELSAEKNKCEKIMLISSGLTLQNAQNKFAFFDQQSKQCRVTLFSTAADLEKSKQILAIWLNIKKKTKESNQSPFHFEVDCVKDII